MCVQQTSINSSLLESLSHLRIDYIHEFHANGFLFDYLSFLVKACLLSDETMQVLGSKRFFDSSR
jgi:hypothetical protein